MKFILKWIADRLRSPERPRVKANIEYYGDQGVRPHRRKRPPKGRYR